MVKGCRSWCALLVDGQDGLERPSEVSLSLRRLQGGDGDIDVACSGDRGASFLWRVPRHRRRVCLRGVRRIRRTVVRRVRRAFSSQGGGVAGPLRGRFTTAIRLLSPRDRVRRLLLAEHGKAKVRECAPDDFLRERSFEKATGNNPKRAAQVGVLANERLQQ